MRTWTSDPVDGDRKMQSESGFGAPGRKSGGHGVSCAILADVPDSRKSSEKKAALSAFRQKDLGAPCKIVRLCLVPYLHRLALHQLQRLMAFGPKLL